ncbi:hypothetical protein ZIOFF_015613 [Zingiber officinale]|uniref:Uncharacterized protein n=1 Tax=Zingiber officinale TaxID=94328 RepID=A0A8J5I0K4_ZINOF|nr:hypothetical protein ZIOFF_015613 [Zingiber officinale]
MLKEEEGSKVAAKVADVETAKTVAIRNFDLRLRMEKKEIEKVGLKMNLVKEEEGWGMPEVGDEVEVHYTGRCSMGLSLIPTTIEKLAVVPPNNTAYFKEEMMSFVKDKESLSMISGLSKLDMLDDSLELFDRMHQGNSVS